MCPDATPTSSTHPHAPSSHRQPVIVYHLVAVAAAAAVLAAVLVPAPGSRRHQETAGMSLVRRYGWRLGSAGYVLSWEVVARLVWWLRLPYCCAVVPASDAVLFGEPQRQLELVPGYDRVCQHLEYLLISREI